MITEKIFGTKKPVIGVVHLLPLPTSARWGGNLKAVMERAEQEATALAAGGVDGIIIENNGEIDKNGDLWRPQN